MPGTVRQQLLEVLREGPATAKDLSRRLGIREREVADHLAHAERSLRARGQHLVVDPPECLACGFAFRADRRHRFRRPSRCPECHGRRITLPEFRVEE